MNLRRVVIAAAIVLAGVAGCGGDEPPGDATPPPDATSPPAPPVTATTAPPAGDAVDLSDVCGLLTEQELRTVFVDGVPEGRGNDYGAGFAECVWEDEAERVVRLSILPTESLQTDYIDQLNTLDQTMGLGEGSVAFPGLVGIGTASSDGLTAGFTAAGSGVLLGVSSGDDTDADADLIHVTVLGQRLLSRAG